MAITLVLGAIIGFCFFSALNHFVVGARGERGRAHRIMGAVAAAAGLYVICTVWLFSAPDIETLKLWSRIQGAVAPLVVAAAFRFANEMLGGWNRRVLYLIWTGLLIMSVVSLLTPAGIFYGDIVGMRRVHTPEFGAITMPVATHSPVVFAWDLLAFLPLAFIAMRAVKVYREGNRRLAMITFIAIAFPAVPALIDTFVLGTDTFPAPVSEAGLALGLMFLSLVISEDVARAAGLRDQLVGSEARHRWLVETSPEAIGVYEARERRFVLVNSRAEQLFGRSARELTNADALDLLYRHTDNAEARVDTVRTLIGRALAGEESVLEWTVVQPDGTRVPCELRFATLGTDTGSLVRISLLDIRERKAREAERADMTARARRSERLHTIGTLADGIAHDFNNLLMPMVAFGELAAEQLSQHDALRYVHEMQASAQRARDVVRQFIPIVVDGGSEQVIVLQPVVKQALRFLRAAIPPRIELDIALDAPDVRIHGDATGVHQIVMNLGLNAAHATDEAGKVRVSLQREDGVVALMFCDRGHGMTPDTVERIFDPFFTTKKGGKGTGLGLSIVRDIVNAWNGSIEVQSAPGEGTIFAIRLPVVVCSAMPAEPARPFRHSNESVLLVDKDQSSLNAITALLESLGYRVSAHREPESALRVLRRRRSFDLCIVDLDMPGMTPVLFAEELSAVTPRAPVILTSGSAEGLRRRPITAGHWFALPKPFGRAELSDALRAALDAPDHAPPLPRPT